jgi:hypothetical protein
MLSRTLHDLDRLSIIMKTLTTQELFAEQEATISGLFHPVGENSYFINHQSILTTNEIVTIGDFYILVYATKGYVVKMFPVKLQSVHLEEAEVSIILLDVLLQRRYCIKFQLSEDETECHFFLMETEYLQHLLDIETVREYCAKSGS